MKADDLAVVQGWDETRATLRRWNARPGRVVAGWALGSLAVTALLLTATWLVAVASIPDLTPRHYPGVTRAATYHDFGFLLFRNGLVLGLHSLACVAGFIAGASMPREAARRSGLSRRIHEHAGPLAIAFVGCATLFSLTTQAVALGQTAADLAAQLDLSPALLLAALIPHALPELFAVFLPLAAWALASRRGRWNELLAATLATTGVAVPLLVLAASVETWGTPRLLVALAG